METSIAATTLPVVWKTVMKSRARKKVSSTSPALMERRPVQRLLPVAGQKRADTLAWHSLRVDARAGNGACDKADRQDAGEPPAQKQRLARPKPDRREGGADGRRKPVRHLPERVCGPQQDQSEDAKHAEAEKGIKRPGAQRLTPVRTLIQRDEAREDAPVLPDLKGDEPAGRGKDEPGDHAAWPRLALFAHKACKPLEKVETVLRAR